MDFTAEQIAQLKAKHGEIFKISVDGKSCLLRKPNRKELGYASVAGKEDPLMFNELILKSCWLDGDKEIMENDDLFLSVGQKIGELISVKEAELEKL